MNNVVLLIGSNALREWGIPVERTNLDMDLIASMDGIKELLVNNPTRFGKIQHSEDANHIYLFPREKDDLIFDIEIAWPDSVSQELIDLVRLNGLGKLVDGDLIAVHPSVVLALKLSHKYKKNSRHFLKTMRDIQYLRSLGFKVPKVLSDWLKRRKKWTYNYKHPKLEGGVSKKDFFNDDGIRYVYDHDAIHVAVKHLHQPAYRFFQPDGEEVGTSKEEFFAQDTRVQLLAVLEESYVLSLERAIVPFALEGYELRKQAFDTALSKVCTSITSGWFRKFAYDNFDAVNALYDQEYVDRFWAAVERGEVAPYNKENGSVY